MIDAVPSTRRRRRGPFIVVLIVGVTLVAVTIWYLRQPGAEELLDRGIRASYRQPQVAEGLLRRALSLRQNRFPDAQLVLLRVQARQQKWADVDATLASLPLANCRADLLLSTGREMLTERREIGLRLLQHVADRAGQKTDNPSADDPIAVSPTAAGRLTNGQHLDGRARDTAAQDEVVADEALELLAGDYETWGETDKLLEVRRLQARQQPTEIPRWITLIQLLVSLSRDQECLTTIQEARQHVNTPQFRIESQNILVSRYINLGQAPAARKALTELRQLEGDSLRVRGRDAFISRLEGNLEQARDKATSVIAEAPTNAYAYFIRGITFLDLKQFDDAIHDLQRVVAAEPQNVAAEFKLSEALRNAGKTEAATYHRQHATELSARLKRISDLKHRIAEQTDRASLYTELAQLTGELGNRNESRRWQSLADRLKSE